MKKILVGLVITGLCISLAGCQHASKTNSNNKPVTPIAEELRMPMSEKVSADIYIDSTYSMGGYVNFPHNTIFIDAVKQIETCISGTWKNSKVNYVKFGDKNIEISREQFLAFANKNFYKDVDTSLNKVIDSVKDEKLNIIVTDLFQTNQDIESLQLALKQKCFNNPKKAVALIGMKSQFNGEIYDIGRNQKAIKYNSSSNVGNYRPFYLLITGSEIDVRVFVDRYSRNAKNCKVAFFSKNIGNPSILTSDGNIRKAEDKGTAPLAVLGKTNGWPSYRLKVGESKSRAYLTLTSGNIINAVPKKFDTTYMNIEQQNSNSASKGFLSKIKNFFKGLFGKSSANSSEYIHLEGVDPLRLITLRSVNEVVEGNKYKNNLRLTVDPSAVNKKTGKYRVSINLTAERESYKNSNRVFSEWNFEDDQVLTDALLSGVGKKTQNINRFTDLLSDMNYEINKPGFNKLYIYFDAK